MRTERSIASREDMLIVNEEGDERKMEKRRDGRENPDFCER